MGRPKGSSGIAVTHGHTINGEMTPTYKVWRRMVQRCVDPNDTTYPRYGAKGITVCNRWLKFEHFLSDMGERPAGLTLDRIRNELGYEPGNCRWATRKEQAVNRTSTIFFEGRCLQEISLELGGNHGLVSNRVKRGWSLERAATTPVRQGNYRKK